MTALQDAGEKTVSRDATPVTAVVGMVGAGQLARMSQAAAVALGVELRFLARSGDEPAAAVSGSVVIGEPDDLEALERFASACDVVTFDHEGVPTGHLRALIERGHVIRPGAEALEMAQDKLHARRRLAEIGLPVPAFAEVTAAEDVEEFAAEHGWPVVLKARRGGYDGRGVVFASDVSEVREALDRGGEWLVEELVAIDCELAQVLARAPSGTIEVYPLVRTIQQSGICVETRYPAEAGDEVERSAAALAGEIAEAIGAAGILAVELFLAGGELVVNELALRPHNTGHWSIEGCETSQFENHLRAVLDWPLGTVRPVAEAAVMTNVLGAPDVRGALPDALSVPRAHPHVYGKTASPGRKVAHVTALGDSLEETAERSRRAATLLGDGGPA